ncbi:hypothetical protein EYC84_010583 [Monilinia fructicola]|uniref:Alpha-1,2-mannosyltransferase n=1 Tax=Monilinia fructicola TaxID=38448 RepID=A0A5M9JAC0_MONFR|nr:hypothetical protein EYC84_010583 [Monilinia fructicola]
MLFNPPRNSPRLMFAVLLTILSLCFVFQWQKDLSYSISRRLYSEIGEIRDPKARFLSFLPRLVQHQPSNGSLKLPEGYLLVRIEEINEESERIDHLTLSDDDFNKSSTAHSEVVKLLPEYDDLITYQKGSRGIITVGGGPYTPALLVSIRMLRRTNCTLPIEVFVPDPSDYDPYSCDIVLRSLNAKCIILPQFENTTIARYQYKSVALLFTTFEDTLFLDADNFPVVDPTSWFDSQAYKTTGMITWPDFWANTASPIYYRLINQTIPSVKSQHASTEAGSILISRSKHNRTLLLAFYYNLFGPGFYYELLAQNGIGGEGDKETWVAAANALGASYYQVRERNHALLTLEGSKEEELDQIISMVQYDFVKDWELSMTSVTKEGSMELEVPLIPTSRNRQDAQIVFLHCNRVKMNPSEVLARLDDFHGRQRMWGSRGKTVERFGRDIEAEVWEEVIEVACRYGETLVGVDDKERVCEDLRRFWWHVLMEEELEDRILSSKKGDSGEKVDIWHPRIGHEDGVRRSG